ncbi:AAA family ATPase [Nonomuraea sp. NPDC050556]|uniref:AAA family ATPase n=1 Tax=Nonomuraea sp. NPDC050556 TaxID=3364369 RepID=UPI0037991BB4
MSEAMRVGADWPLVGRETELARVLSELAAPGSRGVALIGPAGMGRTRLAQEVLAAVKRRGRDAEWLVASRAAATLPFGATASLLPLDEPLDCTAPYEYVRRVIRHLETHARASPLVLVIDDAHLLDLASAALVHQLALRGLVWLCLTVRQAEPAPDAVVALWKDGQVRRIVLEPLASEAVDTLICDTLAGATMDAVARAELHLAAAGNPLALRESLATSLVPRERGWTPHRPLLTGREHEVCLLAAAGLPSRVIAGRLSLSVRTVNNHLVRAYSKLGVSRRDELAKALGNTGVVVHSER